MIIAEKLIAQGKAEGKAEGKTEGEAQGRLRLLQEMMGRAVTPTEELDQLSVRDIQERFEALQQDYEQQFKRR